MKQEVMFDILRRRLQSAASRIFALWYKQRHLQLIVSDEVVAEYYEVLERLNVDERRVEHLYDLLQRAGIVTYVSLGARHAISRDPDDDVLLATAAAGQANFLAPTTTICSIFHWPKNDASGSRS
jgi:predicted nucleic acid-binding protein